MEKAIKQRQTEERVYSTIISMAPCFGIESPTNCWLLPRLPKVTLVDKYPRPLGWAGYSVRRNEMIIEQGYEDEPYAISHEVGHWWHKMLNPGLLRTLSKLDDLSLDESASSLVFLAETIALYGEALFLNAKRLNEVDMLGWTLSELVRIDISTTMSRREEFKELSTDLHKLCMRYTRN